MHAHKDTPLHLRLLQVFTHLFKCCFEVAQLAVQCTALCTRALKVLLETRPGMFTEHTHTQLRAEQSNATHNITCV